MTTGVPQDDYILRFTGYSWSVRRSNGSGAFFCVAEGERDKRAAVANAIALAESARTDVWETVGDGVFWRLRRCRPRSS